MLAATFRPWHAWPGKPTPSHERLSRYRFKATWSSTLDLLEYELGRLDATDIIVRLALEERDIRNDGWPKERAVPSSPGAILSFGHPQHGRVQYAIDLSGVWQHNLRMVGLTLEALRAVDRYGAASRGEQYAGWKALPSSTSSTLTVEAAASVLVREWGAAVSAEHLLASLDGVRYALRGARARSHPDAGGTIERFTLVQEAGRVLAAHHGVAL